MWSRAATQERYPAIVTIADGAWTAVHYVGTVTDLGRGELICDAQVAEPGTSHSAAPQGKAPPGSLSGG